MKFKFSDILYPVGATRLDPKIATGLFLILFSTQLTLTSPFSYLPEMIESFGYSDRDRGLYAGIIASSLFIGRFFGGYFWGWLSDKVGRRPVLLVSASLTFIATISFGFSTTFYFAVITRFLQGMCNGVIVCGRAAFAEICDDTNQALGVSLVFAAWNSAIVLGPALGGFLADPVTKYPNAFKGSTKKFLEQFRYLLPSILVAGFLLVSIIVILFVVDETMKSAIENSKTDESNEMKQLLSNYEDDDDDDISEETFFVGEDGGKMEKKVENTKNIEINEEYINNDCCFSTSITKWSIYELMSDKIVMLVIIMFGISGFCIIGFSELRSLWMATNTIYGGLKFTTNKIGIALLIPAILAAIIQPIVFGRFERRFGGIFTLRCSLVILFISTVSYPYIHYTVDKNIWMWFLLTVLGFFRMTSDISSRSALALFINNSVYPEQAGRVNGLAFSIQEIMRVTSPTMFGALFAWSINSTKHIIRFPLDFRLPFMGIGLSILIIIGLSIFLPKSINNTKPRFNSEKEIGELANKLTNK